MLCCAVLCCRTGGEISLDEQPAATKEIGDVELLYGQFGIHIYECARGAEVRAQFEIGVGKRERNDGRRKEGSGIEFGVVKWCADSRGSTAGEDLQYLARWCRKEVPGQGKVGEDAAVH